MTSWKDFSCVFEIPADTHSCLRRRKERINVFLVHVNRGRDNKLRRNILFTKNYENEVLRVQLISLCVLEPKIMSENLNFHKDGSKIFFVLEEKTFLGFARLKLEVSGRILRKVTS